MIPTSTLETNLETQAVLYPTLRHLVQFLPLDHRRVKHQLQASANHNPFLIDRSTAFPTHKREILQNDVLPDWYTPPSPEPNLQGYLAGQIAVLSLPPRQRDALIYLTGWLSPSGYLEGAPEIWAEGSDWSALELKAVVPVLQRLDPPGIGARSLSECLLLQLDSASLPAVLVQHYLDDLAVCIGNTSEAKQNREQLLQKLHRSNESIAPLDLDRLEAAIRQIQALEPRPGRNFSHTPIVVATPDLKATFQNNGWLVSLAYEVDRDFCLNEEAVKLLAQTDRKSRERQRLEALLYKAQSLLTALNQWQENLLNVGRFLVDRQQAFLQSQDRCDLVPTPQQLIAQSVGLSDATISRIVRDRYLLIEAQPHRILLLQALCPPLRVGGRTPQQVQHLIQQLIDSERSTEPFSDEQLAQLLKVRFGLSIARRTVTKYRKLAGIAASYDRR